jgi:hypothetical protein
MPKAFELLIPRFSQTMALSSAGVTQLDMGSMS